MNSNKNWALEIDQSVYKSLRKMPRRDLARILGVIEGLLHNPFQGDIAKIAGEECVWRRRIGAYRIMYEIISVEKIVHVFQVIRRTSKAY